MKCRNQTIFILLVALLLLPGALSSSAAWFNLLTIVCAFLMGWFSWKGQYANASWAATGVMAVSAALFVMFLAGSLLVGFAGWTTEGSTSSEVNLLTVVLAIMCLVQLLIAAVSRSAARCFSRS